MRTQTRTNKNMKQILEKLFSNLPFPLFFPLELAIFFPFFNSHAAPEQTCTSLRTINLLCSVWMSP